MRTFLAANLGLAPYALFWILVAFLGTEPAMLVGLALSLALNLWRTREREFRTLEAGGLLLFAALELALRAGAVLTASDAVAISFAGLGALALLSVALARPWTAEYARAAFAAEAQSPIFQLVNQVLSTFWGTLFLVDAIAFHLGWPSWATTGLFIFGAFASVFGPTSSSGSLSAGKSPGRTNFAGQRLISPTTTASTSRLSGRESVV